MNQGELTLITETTLTIERVEEIFAVPEIKQLFDELIKKQENNEKLKALMRSYIRDLKHLESLGMNIDDAQNEKEYVWWEIKVAILNEAISFIVINGGNFEKAIEQQLKEQLSEFNIIEKIVWW